jgi:hypothetical protein
MKLMFLKLKTKSFLKKRSTKTSISYDQANTIGVVFTVEDKQKHFIIKDFVKKLEADGKSVQVLEYLPPKHENFEFKFDFFSDQDISFWGNLTSPSALQFVERPFDYLFYIDLSPNPQVLHLLSRTKATCRVGNYIDEGKSYLEMMIESKNSYQTLVESMYTYTRNLK